MILLCSTLSWLSSSPTVAALRRTWPRVRSKMLVFRQRYRLTRREECVNTLRGPARGFKFWCARKRQPRRAMCSLHQLKATKALTRTSKLTATLDHRGAGLPRKSSLLQQSRGRVAAPRYVPQTAYRSSVPIPKLPRPALSHADRCESSAHARKRIARRDAIALAYISQLLFNSLPALERQLDAEQEAEEDAEIARINTRIRQENRELAARRNQQATNSSQAAASDTGTAAGPVGTGL